MYKATKKDFEYFKAQFKRWTILFGCLDWEIDFQSGTSILNDYEAQIRDLPYDRLASIDFNIEWVEKPNNKDLSKAAFHEVWEVKFSDIVELFSKDIPNKIAEREVHKIIRTLENTLFEKYWEEKWQK